MVHRGWFGESFRHTLSAYGIKTSKRKPVRTRQSAKMKVDWKMKKYLAEKIQGGLAEGLPNYKYDPDALYKGMMVEMEHTNDPAVAEEIAKDHLTEDSDYYEKLETMEMPSLNGMFDSFFAKKDESFFAPDQEQFGTGSGSVFEVITGLKPPRVPDIPHEARLLKPEMRRRLAQEQAEVAEMSDVAFHKLEEDDDRSAEMAISDVEAVHEAQDLTRRGRELRFIGGRPLTKVQMEEDE